MRDRVIVCVLKSGVFRPRAGSHAISYGPQHVRWLRDQFAARLSASHRFVCLSDIEIPGVEVIPLRDSLPGWWSKLEIFREFESATYCDLDTVIVGDVGCYLFADHRFTASDGISIRGPGQINSGLMSWSGDYRWLYGEFIADKQRIMDLYTTNAMWGDQGFIRDAAVGRIEFDLFQRRFPGSVVSYKQSMIFGRRVPAGRESSSIIPLAPGWRSQPRIVFFNGRPKPWSVRQSWIPPLAA